jgi:hypothetical protein
VESDGSLSAATFSAISRSGRVLRQYMPVSVANLAPIPPPYLLRRQVLTLGYTLQGTLTVAVPNGSIDFFAGAGPLRPCDTSSSARELSGGLTSDNGPRSLRHFMPIVDVTATSLTSKQGHEN